MNRGSERAGWGGL